MRWFAIVLVMGCGTLSPDDSLALGDDRFLSFDRNTSFKPRFDHEPVWVSCTSQDWAFEWLPPEPLAIQGRFYVDGRYRESHGRLFAVQN